MLGADRWNVAQEFFFGHMSTVESVDARVGAQVLDQEVASFHRPRCLTVVVLDYRHGCFPFLLQPWFSIMEDGSRNAMLVGALEHSFFPLSWEFHHPK